AHAAREQALAERVVDLVGAGVEQVLALEEHAAARSLAEAMGLDERARASRELAQRPVQLGLERRVRAGAGVFLGELVERVDQRLGHEPATVGAEVSAGVGELRSLRHRHRSGPTDAALSMNLASFHALSSGPGVTALIA